MNYDKTVVYDERPGFEAYNAVNFQYPGMNNMGMMPIFPGNMQMQNTSNSCSQIQNKVSNLEQRVSTLEKKVQNLENKLQKLENNLYPKAVDYTEMSSDYINASYQNSMNIM